MKPKKAKEFIPEISENLNLSALLVEDVIDFYWREIRKNLSNLSHSRIHLTNLGDFVIKHWKVEEKITILEKWEIKKLDDTDIGKRFKIAETLYNLRSVKKIMEQENQRKEFIKLYKHELDKKHPDNMEKQGSDS